MAQYFYSNPWADAAAVGNSVASNIAHLAVQIPQIRLQQQRLAQQQALIDAQTQSEMAQAQAYGAHAGLYNRQAAEIGQDQEASKQAGFALGDFAKSYMAGAPDLQQKAQIAVEKFAPYARSKPQEGLAALEKVLSIVRSQGKDTHEFLSLVTGNATAARPMSLGAENRLVSPTGKVLTQPLGFNQTPGEAFQFNPAAVEPTTVDIPAIPTLGPGFPSQQVQARITPAPIVSPIQQRQASQPNVSSLVTSDLEAAGFEDPEEIMSIKRQALERVGIRPGQVGPRVVRTKEEYDLLPPGTVYIDPNGKQGRKP